jgi:hypothetical protein
MSHGWWWHLFHDPIRDELPWSLIALGVILILGGVVLVLLSYVELPRRRRKP